MTYRAEVMADLASQLYSVLVERVHGENGIVCLQYVLRAVRQLYALRSPQSFSGGLAVYALLEGGISPDPAHELEGIATSLSSGCVIEVLSDGRVIERLRSQESIEVLAERAVVYEFVLNDLGLTESIVLPSGRITVPNPNGYPSAYAPPTFWELNDALQFYGTQLAARSTCKILKGVWADDRRLILQNHPEVVMRESLTQHLRSTLRDHMRVLVREEQNVSETRPVDIQISWSLTSQIAIIEVKWLGRCLNAAGDGLATYSHGDARAREGAEQLCSYLDEIYERSPGHEVHGYLVVFDARRRGVTVWEPGEITREDSWYYEGRDVDYEDSAPVRADLAPPVRFFLEPRVPRPSLAPA